MEPLIAYLHVVFFAALLALATGLLRRLIHVEVALLALTPLMAVPMTRGIGR